MKIQNNELKIAQQLDESEQRYKTLFYDNFSVMLLIDPESGFIVDANQAACKYYGYSIDQITKLNINQINILTPNEILAEMQNAKNEKRNHFFFRHRLSNGNIRHVEVYSAKMVVGKKEVLCSIIHDIEDRYQTEKLLKESKEKYRALAKRLKKLNATKDKFFSIISHDLKSPFTSLVNISSFLIDNHSELSPEKIKYWANILYNSSKQTYVLLENLLLWSKLQSKKIAYTPIDFDIQWLIKDVTMLYQTTSAISKQIELKIRIKSEDLKVFADKDMIQTVLRNLISNAIKFTPKGGVVTIFCKQKENDKILLSVSDTGVGISPERQSNLFKIEKTHSTLGTENEKGTGLGLILCKEFVAKNKGKIRVKSTIGKGSKFYFTLKKSKK
ncbi:MAG: PAS domain-containing sensor histidine kinase [Leptospiraceae bacterium]|nr:PAS domain S-box protein [Leptospiraceae bacterium]MCP5496814.1 PAS domain-containing sensor histidine kinase [Leptospiraceae bacterium]